MKAPEHFFDVWKSKRVYQGLSFPNLIELLEQPINLV